MCISRLKNRFKLETQPSKLCKAGFFQLQLEWIGPCELKYIGVKILRNSFQSKFLAMANFAKLRKMEGFH